MQDLNLDHEFEPPLPEIIEGCGDFSVSAKLGSVSISIQSLLIKAPEKHPGSSVQRSFASMATRNKL
jgi:hypothetical protein